MSTADISPTPPTRLPTEVLTDVQAAKSNVQNTATALQTATEAHKAALSKLSSLETEWHAAVAEVENVFSEAKSLFERIETAVEKLV